MYMSEYEINDLWAILTDETPNLQRAALVLGRLKDWTNENSDGWPYWQKPSNAAKRLQEILSAARQAYYRGEVEDITTAQLKAALRPVKAFLTRQGVQHSQVF